MKDPVALALAVAALAFASFVAGRTVGQGEFQPLLNQCERRLDAAHDDRVYFRDRSHACESATTNFDAGTYVGCISTDLMGTR